jgi:large subunit ribosomal protein L6
VSRIGKKLIEIEGGVEILGSTNEIKVKGSKGELILNLEEGFSVKVDTNLAQVINNSEKKDCAARHGLYRSLIANMVMGVSKGFEKNMEIVGVGYRVALQGKDLVFTVGYSHPVNVKAPLGIEFVVEGTNKLKISGIDKQLVGQVAANIRSIRKPDPYKGKGIKYVDEIIVRKQGKSVKK